MQEASGGAQPLASMSALNRVQPPVLLLLKTILGTKPEKRKALKAVLMLYEELGRYGRAVKQN